MSPRRAWPLAALAALALAPLAYVLWLTPVAADGWELVLRARELGGGPRGIWAYARWAHLHHNPRLGEVFDYIVHADGALHVVLTPLVIAATWVGLFVLAWARWPRPSSQPGDTSRLVLVAGLYALGIPAIGQLLAYRPFTSNYVYGFAVTLALVLPYRLDARLKGAPAALGIFVLGVAAGLANEHTGPAVWLVLVAFVAWRARARRPLAAWAVAGLVGFTLGLALLVTAPGQAERYHGLAAETSFVGTLLARGLAGNAARVGLFALCTVVPIAAIAAASLATRRRPRPTVLALAAAALAIVLTVLLSPKQGLRLYYAPAALVVAAAAAALDEACAAAPRARRVLTWLAAAAWLVVAARLVVTYRDVAREASARRALLAAAAPGTTPAVPPYTRFGPSWFAIGDDFRAAHVRQRVARGFYHLDDAWLDVRDPARLAATGPVLTLVEEGAAGPAPALSGQIYEPDDLDVTLRAFRAAMAARGARAASLRLGPPALTSAPLELAAFSDGSFVVPASVAPGAPLPAGARVILVGGDTRPVADDAPRFRPWQGGAYVVVTCSPDLCHVVATALVHSGHGPALGW